MKWLLRGVLAVAGVLLALLGLGAAFVYWDLHREHEFSAADFEIATGQPLPASARILKGESLDWDLHGDHDACALIEVSTQDYERLRAAMRPDRASDGGQGGAPCSAAMYAAFARYSVLAAESTTREGGSFRSWALAAGSSVIMVQYASW